MCQKHISHAGLPWFTLAVKVSLSNQMGLCLLFAASIIPDICHEQISGMASIWQKESNEAPNLASPDYLNSSLYVIVSRSLSLQCIE